MNAEKLLQILLTFAGVVLLSAFFFVFLPTETMASTHERLGLGEFPDAPLTQYLTRSLAGLYGLRGILVLFAATHVRRRLALVRLIGVTDILFGALMIGIDLHAGMPALWFWMEGPMMIPFGALLLWLSTRVGVER